MTRIRKAANTRRRHPRKALRDRPLPQSNGKLPSTEPEHGPSRGTCSQSIFATILTLPGADAPGLWAGPGVPPSRVYEISRYLPFKTVGLEVLYMFEETDRRTPTYEVNWMSHHGRVVLDLDHHPIKDYKDIPLTLASKVEGALMEAIRRIDPRIIIMDFWARLPCAGVRSKFRNISRIV